MPPVFIHQMPAINPGAGASNGAQQQRTTFRPPWVKEGPEPLPLPSAPWTLARTRQRAPEAQETAPVMPNLKPVPRKNSTTTNNNVAADKSNNSSGPSEAAKNEPTPVRKTSKITIIPSRPSVDGAIPKANGHDATNTSTVNSKPNNSRTQQAVTETKSSKSQAPQVKEIPIEIKSTTKPKQEEQKQKSSNKQQEEPKPKINNKQQEEPKPKINNKQQEEQKQKSGNKLQDEPKQNNNVEFKPPKPPAPPMPPPPMPGQDKPMSESKAEKIEALKSRPRKRPDWGAMMKEVESGNRRLKHVQCNDRSSPLLPCVKVKDSFMYESEKPNVHNQLLEEIKSGIRLKRVQTNDRSRPQLDGLRKFRRQLTIEEQIQKAETEETEHEPDELDDIDKVRDDLQSTKQMLALELRNKEAMERENKKLLTRLLNMEVELEKERSSKRQTEERSPQARREEDEQEKRKLKKDLEEAQKSAEEMETKYHDKAGQLDMVQSDLEEALRKNQALERKLQASLLNQDKGFEQPLRKQPSSKKLAAAAAAKESTANMQQALGQQAGEEDEESEYEEVTETESSEDEEEDAEALQERRTARELKLLTTKLKSFKEKEEMAQKERRALREQLKKQQKILREEKKKFKVLQKEVDKMANLMKDDEEEEEEGSEEEEPEESEESESESESEESEEEESDGDLPPEAPAEKKKQNLTERGKRHENCLAALRKGNYLLKANIDRSKDELFKQKEMSLRLQEDLNSVLAELG